MGGGDLNTKKSWHPNTMKNQERVWKAEQAEANEKRRIDDLRREIDSERSREELTHHGQSSGVLAENSSKKMDWMYKQPHESVDREQYLLGKKIDKTFEKIISEEKVSQSYVRPPPPNHVEHECIPFSIRNWGSAVGPEDCQVDMARKMLEDPLVAIRKRELESRAQLLQNPVKLKELTMLLKMDQAESKKKKDKKKNKKNKKESIDIDKKLAEKLNKLKSTHKDNLDIEGLLQSPQKSIKSKSSKKKKKKSVSSSSESEQEEIKQKEKYLNRKRAAEFFSNTKEDRNRLEEHDKNRPDERQRNKSYEKDRNRSEERKRHSPKEMDRNRSERRNRDRVDNRDSNRTDGRDRSKLEEKYRNRSEERDRSRPEGRERNRHEEKDGDRSKERNKDRPEKKSKYDRIEDDLKKPKKVIERPHYDESKNSQESKQSNHSKPRAIASSSFTQKRYNDDSDEEDARPKQKNYGLVSADGSKISLNKIEKHTTPKMTSSKEVKKYEKVRPVKLTEAEKEERRKEMMEDASKRDKERERYVSNYRDQEKKREAMDKNQKYKDDFVEKHLREAAKFISVESRIKSNIYNIQRSNKHMDSNFAKR